MPIHIDILENEVLGPVYKRGLEQGRQEGLQEARLEARQEGLREGELAMLRRQIEIRFGALPDWAAEKLAALPVSELEALCERLLDAGSVEELLG